MKPGFADDLRFDGFADIGLDDDTAGAPDKPGDPVHPVGDADEIEAVASQRVGGTGEFAVTLPVRGPAVMRLMHDKVIVTREDHRETDKPAEQFIQMAGAENSPVREFVLGGIEEVDRHAKREPACQRPPASHCQIVQIAKTANQRQMACHLQAAENIRLGVEFLKFGSAEELPCREGFFHDRHPVPSSDHSVSAYGQAHQAAMRRVVTSG